MRFEVRQGGHVIAQAVTLPHKGHLLLTDVYTAPAHRGAGHMKYLVGMAQRYATSKQKDLVLVVRPHGKGRMPLLGLTQAYERLGFTRADTGNVAWWGVMWWHWNRA